VSSLRVCYSLFMIYTPPTDPYLTVIYQDDDLLVIDKPSGLLSVPGKGEHVRDSVQVRAQESFPRALTVHRLDMETSGLIIMALTKDAHRHLSRQFQDRLVDKIYVAVVDGVVAADEGEIDLPLICDWPNRPKQIVDHEVGKPSLTRWKVLAREKNQTRLALYPETGRSHQLRVHCQAIGHTILGDKLYAESDVIRRSSRLLLHANAIMFTHPVRQEQLTFHSEAEF